MLGEIGASLDERDWACLRCHGHACEPRRRLAEILEEKWFPR